MIALVVDVYLGVYRVGNVECNSFLWGQDPANSMNLLDFLSRVHIHNLIYDAVLVGYFA